MIVILHLSDAQAQMVRELAEGDGHAGVKEAIMEAIKTDCICFQEGCHLGIDCEKAERRWNRKNKSEETPDFSPGDKVTLLPEYATCVATVPQVVPGRVYCVERVNFVHSNKWLRLVGVREHKRKCCDDRGVPACAFRLADGAASGTRKGGA